MNILQMRLTRRHFMQTANAIGATAVCPKGH